MTTAPRSLATPRVEARQFAVGATARAAHAGGLADLADDAFGGHPGQRQTLPRVDASGTFVTYWVPTPVARYLRVQALFTSTDPFALLAGVALKLVVADDGGHGASASPEIPDGLRGDLLFRSAYSTRNPSRLGAGSRQTWYLDVVALVAAGLLRTAHWWRFVWVATMSTPEGIEAVVVDEVPRFLVDDAENFGQLPGQYLPRGLVVDGAPGGLQRLWPTVRAGLMLNLRTYHSLVRPEADPWRVSATTFSSFGGSDEEAAGVPALYRVRPRAMRPGVATRVRYHVRYRLTGATTGDTAVVRLTTGAGTFDVVLGDVSGSWRESDVTTAYLAAGAEDRLSWRAKVSRTGVILDVIARPVTDDPEA